VLVTELAIDGAPAGARPARNLLYFKKTKDLQLPKPDVKLAVADASGGVFNVSVTAKQLARNVFVTSGAVDGAFDDNYFDVLPGETITVKFRPRGATTAGQVQAALSATSIADTY
jgi:beta-mannosidase